jgi:hypothetical protein
VKIGRTGTQIRLKQEGKLRQGACAGSLVYCVNIRVSLRVEEARRAVFGESLLEVWGEWRA